MAVCSGQKLYSSSSFFLPFQLCFCWNLLENCNNHIYTYINVHTHGCTLEPAPHQHTPLFPIRKGNPMFFFCGGKLIHTSYNVLFIAITPPFYYTKTSIYHTSKTHHYHQIKCMQHSNVINAVWQERVPAFLRQHDFNLKTEIFIVRIQSLFIKIGINS